MQPERLRSLLPCPLQLSPAETGQAQLLGPPNWGQYWQRGLPARQPVCPRLRQTEPVCPGGTGPRERRPEFGSLSRRTPRLSQRSRVRDPWSSVRGPRPVGLDSSSGPWRDFDSPHRYHPNHPKREAGSDALSSLGWWEGPQPGGQQTGDSAALVAGWADCDALFPRHWPATLRTS